MQEGPEVAPFAAWEQESKKSKTAVRRKGATPSLRGNIVMRSCNSEHNQKYKNFDVLGTRMDTGDCDKSRGQLAQCSRNSHAIVNNES